MVIYKGDFAIQSGRFGTVSEGGHDDLFIKLCPLSLVFIFDPKQGIPKPKNGIGASAFSPIEGDTNLLLSSIRTVASWHNYSLFLGNRMVKKGIFSMVKSSFWRFDYSDCFYSSPGDHSIPVLLVFHLPKFPRKSKALSSHRRFFKYGVTDYYFFTLLFLWMNFFYYRKKEYLKLGLVSLFALGHLTLVKSAYPWGPPQFHMESSQQWDSRTFMIKEEEVPLQLIINGWSSLFETLLLSALENPGSAKSILMYNKADRSAHLRRLVNASISLSFLLLDKEARSPRYRTGGAPP